MAGAADSREALVRRAIHVDGIVQGVGFRPHVFGLANLHGLAGWVLNSEQGVFMEVEGLASCVEAFVAELRSSPPPLAVIASMAVAAAEPLGEEGFLIAASRGGSERSTTVPADAATCQDCRRELLDPADRRHGYPFINCTNCGPRFTIVRDLPYDRPMTTMAPFSMCPTCAVEYHDPADRRFHAQPNACPDCGPQARLLDGDGREMAGPAEWAGVAAELLRQGKTLAVKGLGGFHLACDAANPEAVALLRSRKRRSHRPFALMARDLAAVRQICAVSEEEARLLTSPSAPIVLLERLGGGVAPAVAPGVGTLGVMLAYTPLHLLLLAAGPPLLVMTSGNPSGLPLCIENEEALERLGGLADAFLLHDRSIHIACDDSVLEVVEGAPVFLRRSRGYVPRPVRVAESASGSPPVLGVGGDLKNAFCLLAGERAVFSQHLGDMAYEEGRQHFWRALDHIQRLTGIVPSVVAHDLHPGYHTGRLAAAIPARLHVPVQHHHAHLAACMAEHRLEGEAIGLILDGTGYGPDGAIWGFEVLTGGYSGFRRIAHLAYSPLPGGAASIRHPLMAAVGMVSAHLGADLAHLFPEEAGRIATAHSMLKAGVNCPPAGSAGRLFDAVAALIGICRQQTYEGQAAIELGAAATPGKPYPFQIQGDLLLPGSLLEALLADLAAGQSPGIMAGRFLATVLEMLVSGARLAREQTGLNAICLGGGTFQSAWLHRSAAARLTAEGFRLYRPGTVPPGDGGLALGQAMIARRRWQERCV